MKKLILVLVLGFITGGLFAVCEQKKSVDVPDFSADASDNQIKVAAQGRMCAEKNIEQLYTSHYPAEYWNDVIADIDTNRIGTDEAVYEVEQFMDFLYDTYIAEYFDETEAIKLHVFFVNSHSNYDPGRQQLIMGKTLENVYTYTADGEIIVLYNDWSAAFESLPDVYSEITESLNGDHVKVDDILIRYKGRSVALDKQVMSVMLHELVHVAEHHDKNFDGLSSHRFYKSLAAEQGIYTEIGINIHFTECQAYD